MTGVPTSGTPVPGTQIPDTAPPSARVPRLWASRRFPAALVGLVVFGGAGTLLVLVILTRTGHAPFTGTQQRVSRDLGHREWSDTWVMLSSGLAILIGLILLACGLVRGRVSMLPLRARPSMVGYIHRRAVEAMIADTAEHVRGTGAVNVNVRPRSVIVLAGARYGDVDAVERELEDDLRRRLDGVELDRPPSLRVRMDRARGRVR